MEAKDSIAEEVPIGVDTLPQIDSFLRESLRVNAFEASEFLSYSKFLSTSVPVLNAVNMTPAIIRRQVLQDFQLANGPKVPRGAWLCVPYRAMMRDERYYPNASEFDGRRFLPKDCAETSPEENSLSARSDKWLLWGVSRLTWYLLHLESMTFPPKTDVLLAPGAFTLLRS